MAAQQSEHVPPYRKVVSAFGEVPSYGPGDFVKVIVRFPIGHYRVPLYLRGKTGTVERLVTPAIDNEEEGFGRNAGDRRYYYRIAFPMTEIWPEYAGPRHDNLRIEVFETWLEFSKSCMTMDPMKVIPTLRSASLGRWTTSTFLRPRWKSYSPNGSCSARARSGTRSTLSIHVLPRSAQR